MPWNPLRNYIFALISIFTVAILFFSGFLEFPTVSPSIAPLVDSRSSALVKNSHPLNTFADLIKSFRKWDSVVGCAKFRGEQTTLSSSSSNVSRIWGSPLQDVVGPLDCGALKMGHVSVLVKGWTWVPDNLDNLYSCRCGLTCLWTKSSVLADKPDAILFETTTPPFRRHKGDPLRVYMDLEAGRKRSGFEDIFVSYHAKDDVQATYAGALFHNNRNYQISSFKNNETLVYWSSSRCLPQRNRLAKTLLDLLPHHSFGKCLNNVGGPHRSLSLYPQCQLDPTRPTYDPHWYDHLHCVMSNYKFVLAIENTATESYITEKLFYALDAGSVPIYFGAPDVGRFVPPGSIIDGSRFRDLGEVAAYVRSVGDDEVAYAGFHAWRRCGVLGEYGKTRALSLDTLPCRVCEEVSKKGGRGADI